MKIRCFLLFFFSFLQTNPALVAFTKYCANSTVVLAPTLLALHAEQFALKKIYEYVPEPVKQFWDRSISSINANTMNINENLSDNERSLQNNTVSHRTFLSFCGINSLLLWKLTSVNPLRSFMFQMFYEDCFKQDNTGTDSTELLAQTKQVLHGAPWLCMTIIAQSLLFHQKTIDMLSKFYGRIVPFSSFFVPTVQGCLQALPLLTIQNFSQKNNEQRVPNTLFKKSYLFFCYLTVLIGMTLYATKGNLNNISKTSFVVMGILSFCDYKMQLANTLITRLQMLRGDFIMDGFIYDCFYVEIVFALFFQLITYNWLNNADTKSVVQSVFATTHSFACRR